MKFCGTCYNCFYNLTRLCFSTPLSFFTWVIINLRALLRIISKIHSGMIIYFISWSASSSYPKRNVILIIIITVTSTWYKCTEVFIEFLQKTWENPITHKNLPLKMAIISIRNFAIYKSNHETFFQYKYGLTWYILIYIYMVQRKTFSRREKLQPAWYGYFSLISLKPAMYLQWDGEHLPMLKCFIWHCIISAEFISNRRKKPKLVIFGADNLCAATKTFWRLIRIQQMWHGWKANITYWVYSLGNLK